jgi:hypothetical protein
MEQVGASIAYDGVPRLRFRFARDDGVAGFYLLNYGEDEE